MVFFSVIFILYFTLFQRFQKAVLFFGSCVFISSYKIEYLLLLLIIGTISYFSARLIENKKHYAKQIITVSSIIQLMVLFYFKYLNFSIGILFKIQKYLLHWDIEINESFFKILLPVGISFYILQSIGYLVDVYKGKVFAEKNWVAYILFLGYFPKLTLGPIERAENLISQLHETHQFDYDRAVAGLRICLVGLFKKVAVADSIAVIVNNVYDNCYEYSGLALIIATILYAFQIYCDFSGYTDMAIGISKILGIDLMENFNCPYLSTSVTEFWRRWHISLSTWFRDYVYIPLGGNRVKLPRYFLNILITMTVSGIWHGANLTFIAWGFLNGVLLCIEKVIGSCSKKRFKKNHIFQTVFKICVTFSLICLTWIFFRANCLSDAIYIFKNIFNGMEISFNYFRMTLVKMGFTKFYCLIICAVILIQIVIDIIHDKDTIQKFISEKTLFCRWAIYILTIVFVLYCKIYIAESQQFIYFNF